MAGLPERTGHPPLGQTVLRPVGPLEPRVYWTRRLVLLAVLAVLIAVVALSCSGGGKPAPRRAATPVTSPSPSASSARANGPCVAADLAVSASTDADKYAAGTLPRLTVAITTTGSVPCVLTDSPSARTWTITSGADQIWTTAGCQSAHNAGRVVLKPGGAPLRHTIVWNRHRSDKKCAVSSAATPGTYQLVVTVKGAKSQPAIFHLTA